MFLRQSSKITLSLVSSSTSQCSLLRFSSTLPRASSIRELTAFAISKTSRSSLPSLLECHRKQAFIMADSNQTRNIWTLATDKVKMAPVVAPDSGDHIAKRDSSSSVRVYEQLEVALKDHDERQVELMEEMIIEVDQNDQIIGPKSKKETHLMANIDNGVLHRAFSFLLFNSKGEFLLTQRSDLKITFPSYWTNTCCSHPLYIEPEMETKDDLGIKRAAQRRCQIELGINPSELPVDDIHFMTKFLYKAPSDCGIWGEHEIDYILIAQLDVNLDPDPNEVKSIRYVGKHDLIPFLDHVQAQGGKVTPWFRAVIENFMFKYWENLDNLEHLKDPNTLHQPPYPNAFKKIESLKKKQD